MNTVISFTTLTAAAAILLTGCAAKQTQAYRPFVAPPVREVPATELPGAPELAIRTEPLDILSLEMPNDGSSFVDPTPTGVAISEAYQRLEEGQRALEQGRLAGARLVFDRAVAAILQAPATGDPMDKERRGEALARISASIRQADLEGAAAKVSAEEAMRAKTSELILPAPTFPVDPRFDNPMDARVRQGIGVLPIEMNQAVADYISFFSAGEGRKVLEIGLRRFGRYEPMIERVLAEYGLPQELRYLAQVESKFDPNAVSDQRCCVGMWQFGRDAGRENGLNRTNTVDDRRDPELATLAAARHLSDLYAHYGDWYLAMAAYNCGPGCLDRAIFNTGYADFWDLRRLGAIPHQTADYIPQVIAMAIMLRDPAAYGIVDPTVDPPLLYEDMELQAETSLELIATAVGQPLEALQELNPALLKDVAPVGYRLHVPLGTMAALERAFEVIPPSKRTDWRIHRMFPGDTAEILADLYDTSEGKVLSANHGTLPESGQWAAIPVAY